MDYKLIPGFDKFEINEEGEVRNAKTKRVTKPYHTSEKTGPMVHLLDTKAGLEGRLSAVKLVKDLFGTKMKGWDLDPDKIAVKATVDRKPRLTDAERKGREDAKAKAAAEREVKRAEAKALRDAEKAKKDAEKAATPKPKSEAKAKAEEVTEKYKLVDLSAQPDEIDVPSDLEPGVIFKMKKAEFKSADGSTYIGYKVAKKIKAPATV